jgi:hypothetical protein
MGVGGQRPGHFTPGNDPVPIYRRLARPQGRAGRVRNISPPPAFDPRTVQFVASRYTDSRLKAEDVHLSTLGLY